MYRFSLLAVLSALVLVGSVAQAQDSSSGLLEVLGKAKAATLNGSASISEEKPQAGIMGGAAMAVVVGRSGGAKASPFKGEVEVFVKDGAITAASYGDLPRVKIYQKDGKQLFSQLHSNKPVDTKSLAILLSRALDMDSLMAEVKRAKRVRTKVIEDGINYRVTIDGDYFDQKADEDDGGPRAQVAMVMSSMSASVLEGVLSVDVNGVGELTTLTLEVQYNDPMADMIAKALKGGGEIQISGPDDLAKKSTTPGKKITLNFAVSDTQSEAAQAFAKEAAEALK